MKLPQLAFVIALLSPAVHAQTGGLPPEQAAAGNPQKFVRSTATNAAASNANTGSSTAPAKATTKTQRRAARNEKRLEKVGPKPLD